MGLSIKGIAFKNFRSYDSFELDGLGSLTVLVGPNAVGKTNVVEGIQLLTAQSSFRNPTLDQIVKHGSSSARLDARLRDGKRDLELSLRVAEGRKRHFVNGKPRRAADLKGVLPSVVFTPDDLELAKGAASVKRAAFDTLGSQLSKNHYLIKRDYEKVIRHKNRLLKEEASRVLMESINEMLVTCGAQLCCYRAALFDKLMPLMSRYYSDIAKSRERLTARYTPSWAIGEVASADTGDRGEGTAFSFTRDEARVMLSQALERAAGEERSRRRAIMGPHADRIEFFIGGRDAALYGSQGQQRSLVLAFKLAEADLIQDILQQKPVLLLDDVMSELDASRRNALVSFVLDDIQTFITTTTLEYFDGSLLDAARIVELPLSAQGG